MIKKATVIFFMMFLIHQGSNAQTFMHGFGATISIMIDKVTSPPGTKYTNAVSFSNLTYFPRFNLTESANTSLSIGAPIGAGIGFDVEGGTIYYGVDLPLVVDFNMGRKSSYENEDRFGWYIGGGFGYMLTNWTDGSSTEKLNSYGPLIRTGIRFGAGRKNPDKAVTMGFYFKPGLERSKIISFGVAVLTEL
ncbi:MAG TPA: hypothetical protein VLJ68_07270 [Chitinophagaceae bacterium]|nr:hypothetical protein [Chitinophagaceae bacterium]